jgi:hypothetical protein
MFREATTRADVVGRRQQRASLRAAPAAHILLLIWSALIYCWQGWSHRWRWKAVAVHHRFLLQLIPTAVLLVLGQLGAASADSEPASKGDV